MNSTSAGLREFVLESNRIEGIHRDPTYDEIEATAKFLALPKLSPAALCGLVAVYAPGKPLRQVAGMDVRVGKHTPPRGGPHVLIWLNELLEAINTGYKTPFQGHVEYETLHPFMDGNGRSGRAIWLWQMQGEAPLGFLHTFYYQTLQAVGR